MKRRNAKPRINIGRVLLVGIPVSILCFLIYFQLLYKPPVVESNIYRLSKTIPAHTSDVWTVMFSPDGSYIASGSVDSTVKLWDRQTGALVLTLTHPAGVTYLVFSPNGKWMATASYDETIRLWKLPEGTLARELKGCKGTVWCVGFSPDGQSIVSSGEDAVVRVWNAESGALTQSFTGHSLNTWTVQFSPDGQTIASGSFDKTIKIWDIKTGKVLKNLNLHTQAVVALAFSSNGKYLVSTSDDKTIKLWDTHNWKLLRSTVVPEHAQAADFSPDDRMLVTAGRDKTTVGEFLQNFMGDSEYNKGVSMRLWDVASGRLLQTFSIHANDVNDAAFSPDGKWIAAASSDKTVSVWQLNEQ
jgi:WD40 repeat protein